MDIDNLRAQIDAIDAKIVEALSERCRLAVQIGKLKHASNAEIYAPDREDRVLRRLEGLNQGPLPPAAIRRIYTEIISACRALERPHRVAFLGPEGTFTHQAAKKQFGGSSELAPVGSITDVFREFVSGRVDHGVVPIENSSEGAVGETLDAFMDFDVKVCGEIQLPIHHNLMAKPGHHEIRRIYSKSVVFGQCRGWLADHYPNVDLIDAASTTLAAREAAVEPNSAAIGHREAAELYGLEIISPNIEDSPHNATRFLILGKTFGQATGQDKTSILCFIRDEVGALFNLIRPFSESSVNLTKIESWPSKRKAWDYCFFIDMEGHADDAPVRRALEQVSRHCSEMRLLGSYPRAPRTE